MKYFFLICLMSSVTGLVRAEGPLPSGADAMASMMTDPTQNASAFKDPRAFSQLTGAMMNPAMAPSMGMTAMDPGTYTRMVYGMLSPAAFQNYMQLANPAVAANWMGASMNPNFYMGMMSPLMNPANYTGWMMMPMDPRWMNMASKAINPGYYAQMMSIPMDPKVMGLMMAPANPQTYTNWMGAVANPGTYPIMMQMIPSQMPAAGAAPASSK